MAATIGKKGTMGGHRNVVALGKQTGIAVSAFQGAPERVQFFGAGSAVVTDDLKQFADVPGGVLELSKERGAFAKVDGAPVVGVDEARFP
jgi:hypothetical protein